MTVGTTPTAGAGDSWLYRSCVYPFALFLGISLILWILQGAIQWEHPDALWWQRSPEMLVYPLQTMICAGYLWYIRRSIPWSCTGKNGALGVAFGLVGIALWLVPYYAGWVPNEGGFEPSVVFGADSGAVEVEYAFRFARAVLIVPFVEELFWRGFLMRWCVNRDFPQDVPFGTPSLRGYIIVTLCFMLVHHPVDYVGALLYGTLAYILTVKTKQLMPVIVMHAVANLVMGICAVVSELPQLW